MRTETFYTQYRRPKKADFLEVNSGEDIVEQSYVPLSKMIETMTEAGVRLAEHRKMAYHFGPEEKVPDDFIDLSIQPGIEIADVQAVAEELEAKLQKQAEFAEGERKQQEKSEVPSQPEPPEKESD